MSGTEIHSYEISKGGGTVYVNYNFDNNGSGTVIVSLVMGKVGKMLATTGWGVKGTGTLTVPGTSIPDNSKIVIEVQVQRLVGWCFDFTYTQDTSTPPVNPWATPMPTPSPAPMMKITGIDYDYTVTLGNDIAKYTWSEAMAFAKQKNQEKYLGYSDWRVPNVMESRYMFDNKTALGLRLNSNFWTSETYEKTTTSAYGLRTSSSITSYQSDTRQNILQSLFGTYVKETNKFYVRLIRG